MSSKEKASKVLKAIGSRSEVGSGEKENKGKKLLKIMHKLTEKREKLENPKEEKSESKEEEEAEKD